VATYFETGYVMIISHKYKFIFLKTTKTAGTSIEIALSRYCEKGDIVTPISREDERSRRSLGYCGPQNHRSPLSDYKVKDISKLILKGKRKTRFHNHISAKEVKGYLSEDVWNNYYKFCFERNPWDKIISFYYYKFKSASQRPTISEFIESGACLDLKKGGFGKYTIDGEVVVDKICRFENLREEIDCVSKKLGIPGEILLTKAKSGFRTDARHYSEVLDAKARLSVADVFRDEIELLGYEF